MTLAAESVCVQGRDFGFSEAKRKMSSALLYIPTAALPPASSAIMKRYDDDDENNDGACEHRHFLMDESQPNPRPNLCCLCAGAARLSSVLFLSTRDSEISLV